MRTVNFTDMEQLSNSCSEDEPEFGEGCARASCWAAVGAASLVGLSAVVALLRILPHATNYAVSLDEVGVSTRAAPAIGFPSNLSNASLLLHEKAMEQVGMDGANVCQSVANCSGAQCSATHMNCWNAVRQAMTNRSNLLSYNWYWHFWFGNDHSPQWYPTSTEAASLSFDNFQMLVHLHDPVDGVCPKPCFPPSAPEAAPSAVSACPPMAPKPQPPPNAMAYNGITWPEMCFEGDRDEHVLLIGDWGGINPGLPAQNNNDRDSVEGLDNQAQSVVAKSFNRRSKESDPRYILNVGDNFYWGGCDGVCFSKTMQESINSFLRPNISNSVDSMGALQQHIDEPSCPRQFYSIFETMYMGEGLDGKPWISCLGNHDYGGRHYWAAWDQQIAYTWGPSGRWVLPALYYHQHVRYPTKGFTVDYYILDTSAADASSPDFADADDHNLCGYLNNGKQSCWPLGPRDPHHCVTWFKNLWAEQFTWLKQKLAESVADWQIIMTHFPPETCVPNPQFVLDLKSIKDEFGIDLVIAGHRHMQGLFENGENGFSTTAGIPYIITGGGGGITSDDTPGKDGKHGDWMYGFMDMTLSKTLITIEAFNYDGGSKGTMQVRPRTASRSM